MQTVFESSIFGIFEHIISLKFRTFMHERPASLILSNSSLFLKTLSCDKILPHFCLIISLMCVYLGMRVRRAWQDMSKSKRTGAEFYTLTLQTIIAQSHTQCYQQIESLPNGLCFTYTLYTLANVKLWLNVEKKHEQFSDKKAQLSIGVMLNEIKSSNEQESMRAHDGAMIMRRDISKLFGFNPLSFVIDRKKLRASSTLPKLLSFPRGS